MFKPLKPYSISEVSRIIERSISVRKAYSEAVVRDLLYYVCVDKETKRTAEKCIRLKLNQLNSDVEKYDFLCSVQIWMSGIKKTRIKLFFEYAIQVLSVKYKSIRRF